MKIFRIGLLIIAMLWGSVASWGYDFKVDGIYYNVNTGAEPTVSVTSGDAAYQGHISIPETVTYKDITYVVTEIGRNAFCKGSELTDIILPKSVKVIRKEAFAFCDKLTSIILPNTITDIEQEAFSACKALTSITLPKSIKTIKRGTFEYCSELTSISLPNTLTYIEDMAFLGCTGLKSLILPESVGVIGQQAFSGCLGLTSITLPNTATIGAKAFKGCRELTNVSLPKAVIIKEYAFEFCSNLNSITLPTSVQVIEREAFSNCNGLTSVTIPSNIKKLGGRVFYACENLATVQINAKGIERDYTDVTPFYDCKSLKDITFDDSVTVISCNLFKGCKSIQAVSFGKHIKTIEYGAFSGCNEIKRIVLPESLETIGSYAFEGCDLLTLDIPSAMKHIGKNAFRNCKSLKTIINHSDSLTLGEYAFEACPNLCKVDLGKGVGILSDGCFGSCTNLQWINLGENISAIGSQSLTPLPNLVHIGISSNDIPSLLYNFGKTNFHLCTLHVPQGHVDVYKASTWGNRFKNITDNPMPEYEYCIIDSVVDSVYTNPEHIAKGYFTGKNIKEIRANKDIKVLDLRKVVISYGKEAYYINERLNPSGSIDIDAIRHPGNSHRYYTNDGKHNTQEQYEELNLHGNVINRFYRYYCNDLTNAYLNGNISEIRLPEKLEALGSNAIMGNNLKDLYVFSEEPPTATLESFGNTNMSTCTLHVPAGCAKAYGKASGWNKFKNIVDIEEGELPTLYSILHQPTPENLSVALDQPVPDAQYQWYKKGSVAELDITDLLSGSPNWERDQETLCCANPKAKTRHELSMQVELSKNATLSFDWAINTEEHFDKLKCYFNDQILLNESGMKTGSFSKTFDSDTTGTLRFEYIKDVNISPENEYVRLSHITLTGIKNGKQIIRNGVLPYLTSEDYWPGDFVWCEITLPNGEKLNSDTIETCNSISKQPSPEDMTVELLFDDPNAVYSWYKYGIIKSKTTNITEEMTSSPQNYPWKLNNGTWTSTNTGQNSSCSEMSKHIDIKNGTKLSLDWKVSSEKDCDELQVILGNRILLEKSGEDTGTLYFEIDTTMFPDLSFGRNSNRLSTTSSDDFYLTPDEQPSSPLVTSDLCIRYKKDSSYSEGDDMASVSNITITDPEHIGKEKIEETTDNHLASSMYSNGNKIWCVITLSNGKELVSDSISISSPNDIKKIAPEALNKSYTIYNLQGILVLQTSDYREILNLPQGIYIINGKKRLVK